MISLTGAPLERLESVLKVDLPEAYKSFSTSQHPFFGGRSRQFSQTQVYYVQEDISLQHHSRTGDGITKKFRIRRRNSL